MAYCPECKGEMSATEIVCPHCGYDFPASGYNRNTGGGFAYSGVADVALIVSMCAATIGACAAAIAAIVAIAQGQFMNGLLVYPIACLLQLGMLVVFIRVQQ
jgi:hypothetical protein